MLKLSKWQDLVIILAAVCNTATQLFVDQAFYPQSLFVPRPPSSTRFSVSQPNGYQEALDYLYGEINYEKLGLSGAAQHLFPVRLKLLVHERLCQL